MTDLMAVIIAALALGVTLTQWLSAQRAEHVRLLLGDRESVGYAAMQILRRPYAGVSQGIIHALVLVTIFEPSDRARLQVYRTLDALRPRYGEQVKAIRATLVYAGDRFAGAVDITTLRKRLDQLDRSLPWIAEGQPTLSMPPSSNTGTSALPRRNGEGVTTHTEESSMTPSSNRWRAVLSDFLERAGWSAGQVFFATLLAGGSAVSPAQLPWKYAATLALGAAVSAAVLTALQYLAKVKNLTFWPDQLLRLVKTFLSSLSASFVAATVFDVTTFDWKTAFNIAFLATLGALAKGLLAREPTFASQERGIQPPKSETAVTLPAPTTPSPSTLPPQIYDESFRR